MTEKEMQIRACLFAVSEMKKRGSYAFVTTTPSGALSMPWDDVLLWLSKEEQKERTVQLKDGQNNDKYD